MIRRQLGLLPPEELRRRNLFSDTGYLPNGQVIPSSAARATYERAWELFRDESIWGKQR